MKTRKVDWPGSGQSPVVIGALELNGHVYLGSTYSSLAIPDDTTQGSYVLCANSTLP